MLFSQVEFDDLRLGMKLISERGVPGKITLLANEVLWRQKHDVGPWIQITWDSGKRTEGFYFDDDYGHTHWGEIEVE